MKTTTGKKSIDTTIDLKTSSIKETKKGVTDTIVDS